MGHEVVYAVTRMVTSVVTGRGQVSFAEFRRAHPRALDPDLTYQRPS